MKNDGSGWKRAGRRLTQLVAAFLFGSVCGSASAIDIGAGFTGAWYDPQQNGHGLFLQVLPNNNLMAFWFTFTPDGTQQSWFGGVGSYSGNAATVPVDLTTGGRWIPNFDPSKIVNNPWGTLTLTFTDCDHGRVDFTSTYPGYGSNHMDVTRLTPVLPGTSCTSSTTVSKAAGVWSGTTSANENVVAVVLEDGGYEIVYSKPGTSTDVGLVRGTSSADGGTFSSSDATNFPIAQTAEATGFATTASVSGTLVPASQLNLTMTTRSGTRTLVASYVAGSDQPPTLASPAGVYAGYNGHIGGRQDATFKIDAAGNVSGSNAAGCSYNGTITPHASVRAFDWTINATNIFCIFSKRTLSGLLYYDEGARQVRAFAVYQDDAGAADQYFFIGGKN